MDEQHQLNNTCVAWSLLCHCSHLCSSETLQTSCNLPRRRSINSFDIFCSQLLQSPAITHLHLPQRYGIHLIPLPHPSQPQTKFMESSDIFSWELLLFLHNPLVLVHSDISMYPLWWGWFVNTGVLIIDIRNYFPLQYTFHSHCALLDSFKRLALRRSLWMLISFLPLILQS